MLVVRWMNLDKCAMSIPSVTAEEITMLPLMQDKGERRLLPKLPSLKRRRRCYALHLLAGPEGNSNESGL